MNITLGTTTAPKKQVSKTLSNGVQYAGAFRNGDVPSDRDPVIIVNVPIGTAMTYNYAQIFGQYYFIRERKAVTATSTEITFHKDVLNTFSSGIRSHTCIIDRQESENVGDYDIDDAAFVVKRSELEIIDFPNLSHTMSFVLATAGIN